MKTHEQGFTLLELLMVVIIIGILAAVAIPQYLKTREKARMAEAISLLGQIRSSETRYYAENDNYVAVSDFSTTNPLDFDPTDTAGAQLFTYSVVSGAGTDFQAIAKRVLGGAAGGCDDGYQIVLEDNGALCGTDCQDASLTNCP